MMQQHGEEHPPLHRRTPLRRRRNRFLLFLRELFVICAIGLTISILLWEYVVQCAVVSGPSMRETFHTGNRVLLDLFRHRFWPLRRGEIVVFKKGARNVLIKRVIALAGDRVSAVGGQVWLNGRPLREQYLCRTMYTPDFAPVAVPLGFVFVMGDNRLNSSDSRTFGCVSLRAIDGWAVLVLWPLQEMRWCSTDTKRKTCTTHLQDRG